MPSLSPFPMSCCLCSAGLSHLASLSQPSPGLRKVSKTRRQPGALQFHKTWIQTLTHKDTFHLLSTAGQIQGPAVHHGPLLFTNWSVCVCVALLTREEGFVILATVQTPTSSGVCVWLLLPYSFGFTCFLRKASIHSIKIVKAIGINLYTVFCNKITTPSLVAVMSPLIPNVPRLCFLHLSFYFF